MHFNHNTKYLFIAVGHRMSLDALIEEFDIPELRHAKVSYVRRMADEDTSYFQMEATWRHDTSPELYGVLVAKIRSTPDRQGLALFAEDHETATEFLVKTWERVA